MGMNFPSSPANGQVFRPGINLPNWYYRASDPGWVKNTGTALPRNLLVNPAMKVIASAYSGNQASNAGFFPVENWRARWTLAATGMIGASCYDDAVNHTYPFHANYIYFNVGTALPTLGANDFALIEQLVEGYRCADLAWGTGEAKAAVLRFTALMSRAGVYSVRVRNAANDRTWYSNFTYNGGYQEFVFSIPPCTDGVWSTDNTACVVVAVHLAVGSSLRDSTDRSGQWLAAGSLLGGPGQINNSLDTATHNLGFFAAGLYVDPNHTGLAPPFEVPAYEDDLEETQRYYQKIYTMRGVASGSIAYAESVPVVPMRTTPAFANSSPAVQSLWDGTTGPAVAGINTTASNERQFYLGILAASALTTGRIGHMIFTSAGTVDRFISANARL